MRISITWLWKAPSHSQNRELLWTARCCGWENRHCVQSATLPDNQEDTWFPHRAMQGVCLLHQGREQCLTHNGHLGIWWPNKGITNVGVKASLVSNHINSHILWHLSVSEPFHFQTFTLIFPSLSLFTCDTVASLPPAVSVLIKWDPTRESALSPIKPSTCN